MALTSLIQIKKRLEVSKNVKYIAVALKASKLQVFKVPPGRDLNLDLPRESLNIGIMTHAGGPGCTLHFWKPLIFFYLDKRGQGLSYILNTQKSFVKIPGFTQETLVSL